MSTKTTPTKPAPHLVTARQGEDLVATWLREHGWEILERNLRIGHDELDIVARRGGLIAVCEVRTRRGERALSPETSIDHGKRQRLRRAALGWLATRAPGNFRELRFDVAAVLIKATKTELRYFEAAFE